MKNIALLKKELEVKEGRRRKAYLDTEGNWTIGVGHLLNPQTDAELAILLLADDLDNWEGFEISEEQIEELLDHDITETMHRLRNAFDEELLENLDPKRFMACFQMAYQIGSVTGFPAFCNAVREGDWDRAADEMLYRDGLKKDVWSLWRKQTSGRCESMAELMRVGSQVSNQEPEIHNDVDLSAVSSVALLAELTSREKSCS